MGGVLFNVIRSHRIKDSVSPPDRLVTPNDHLPDDTRVKKPPELIRKNLSRTSLSSTLAANAVLNKEKVVLLEI